MNLEIEIKSYDIITFTLKEFNDYLRFNILNYLHMNGGNNLNGRGFNKEQVNELVKIYSENLNLEIYEIYHIWEKNMMIIKEIDAETLTNYEKVFEFNYLDNNFIEILIY